MKFLNVLINLLRSVPFLILMVLVFPLTRLLVGTVVGTVASIVPLVIAAFPFIARLAEGSLREVNPNTNPSKWVFIKGLHLQQFDQSLHIQANIEADTAYYYDTKRLWELRGRVQIRTKNQLQFNSEELFWDENQHQLYSNKYSTLKTPERQLQGAHFISNEQMTKYHVTNSKGAFERTDIDGGDKATEEEENMIARPPKQPLPQTTNSLTTP